MKRAIVAGLSLLSILAIATPAAAVIGQGAPETPEDAVELNHKPIHAPSARHSSLTTRYFPLPL